MKILYDAQCTTHRTLASFYNNGNPFMSKQDAFDAMKENHTLFDSYCLIVPLEVTGI